MNDKGDCSFCNVVLGCRVFLLDDIHDRPSPTFYKEIQVFNPVVLLIDTVLPQEET
jgi:hypothetical protein